jgi:hypothetical protein
MMGRDLGIADRIRAAGIPVVEVAGWQTRGADDLDARGAVMHHTAGGPTGTAPSLAVCIHGRDDVPGPLCHVLQSREPDGHDRAYVIASGRAHHAGAGGWRGLAGNRTVYGLEVEHVGTVPLPAHRQEIAARILAALIGPHGDPTLVCQHREWAPGRKIDAATGVNGDHIRHLVARALTASRPPTSPQEAIAMGALFSDFVPGAKPRSEPGWKGRLPFVVVETTPTGFKVTGFNGAALSPRTVVGYGVHILEVTTAQPVTFCRWLDGAGRGSGTLALAAPGDGGTFAVQVTT